MDWLRRNWKAIPVFILASALALLVLYVWLVRLGNTVTYRHVTGDQRFVLRTLGPPPRFTVTYLPLGEKGNHELVRSEIWYYPHHRQSISFVRGQIASIHDISASTDAPAARFPTLRPWQVDITMTRSDVASLTGDPGTSIALVPDLEDRHAVEAYVCRDALYAFERGRLIYFQSVGRGVDQ